ncbi:MAG: hypothetical protein JWN67_5062 [Actinomycetia bacterium]|nr:hypothetical protein [Actinomycetes bacterium]
MTMTDHPAAQQQRDNEVKCRICRKPTWNESGMCDRCDSAIPLASSAPDTADRNMAAVPASSISSPARTGSRQVLPEVVRISGLNDPTLAARGHHVRDLYVETFWLPILGPSAVWLLRHASFHIDASGQYIVGSEELGKRLGLNGVGRGSPLCRAFDRLVNFHAAVRDGDDTWRFRLHLGDLPRRHVGRLDEGMQKVHGLHLQGGRVITGLLAAAKVPESADLQRTAPTPPASVATGGDIPGASTASRLRCTTAEVER